MIYTLLGRGGSTVSKSEILALLHHAVQQAAASQPDVVLLQPLLALMFVDCWLLANSLLFFWLFKNLPRISLKRQLNFTLGCRYEFPDSFMRFFGEIDALTAFVCLLKVCGQQHAT
jgi:hypothetical protein